MSFIYILPLKDKSTFKIGKSEKPMKRITHLLNFYDIDVENSIIINCKSTNASFELETLFHFIFKDHQQILEYDGGTEFFDFSVYEDAIDLCNLICKNKQYSKTQFQADPTVKQLSDVDIEANKFSNLVRNKRLSINITQSELAKISKVSKRTVERFEKAGQTTFRNVLKMCSVLGIENIISPSNNCPISSRKRSKKRKIFVGDSDHEPDEEWVRTI